MFNIKYFTSQIWYSFPDASQEEVYSQSSIVDVTHHFKSYNFLEYFPEKETHLQSFFRQPLNESHSVRTLSEFLQQNAFIGEHIELVRKLEFKILNANCRYGMILEHPQLGGWIIKKNYSELITQGNERQRIRKGVRATQVPSALLNSKNKALSDLVDVTILAYHDYNNPLRVEVLQRGKYWIKKLGLNLIEVSEEYLYPLPDTSEQLPLHQRTIVLSKKIDLLDSLSSIEHYVQMAIERPSDLEILVRQICIFIKHTQIIDNHLDNIRFLANGSDTVLFMDGEPGNLRDVTHEPMAESQNYDVSVFSIVGLRNLQHRITKDLFFDEIAYESSLKTQTIFNQIIDEEVNQIIKERQCDHKKSWTHFIFPGYFSTLLTNTSKAIAHRISAICMPADIAV